MGAPPVTSKGILKLPTKGSNQTGTSAQDSRTRCSTTRRATANHLFASAVHAKDSIEERGRGCIDLHNIRMAHEVMRVVGNH